MKKVKVFALSTCPWCKRTKEFFQGHKIEFECIDYDKVNPKKQEQAMDEIQRYGGGESFPFVIIGEEGVEGYNPELYCELLGING